MGTKIGEKLILGLILGITLVMGMVVRKLLPQTLSITYKNLNSMELKYMLASKDFFMVNVHVPYEGEIEPTDAFIAYDEIDRNLDKLPGDKNSKIVLYCRSGRMSEMAAETLVGLGYTNVYNLMLGMHDWQANGYPLKGL